MNLNIIIFLDNIEKKLKYIALYGGFVYTIGYGRMRQTSD